MKTLAFSMLLFFAFCSTSFAPIIFMLGSPPDDSETRQKVLDRTELKSMHDEYWDIIATRLLPLKLDDVAKIFGPELNKSTEDIDTKDHPSLPRFAKRPEDMIWPLIAGGGFTISGFGRGDHGDKSHVDLHAVGNIGYIECFYQISNRTNLETAVLYLRRDDKFVSLKSESDYPKRMEWEKAKFAALKDWLNEHLPKVKDLGGG